MTCPRRIRLDGVHIRYRASREQSTVPKNVPRKAAKSVAFNAHVPPARGAYTPPCTPVDRPVAPGVLAGMPYGFGMQASARIHIEQQLANLKPGELATVASAVGVQRKDLECQQDVLTEAPHDAGQLLPTHVGGGERVAISVATGALFGLARGAFGDLWGCVASAAPALVGVTFGLASKDASMNAAGFAIFAGATAGEAAIKAYDLGQILRAKMKTVGKPQVHAHSAA
jgi:hypothetical protein